MKRISICIMAFLVLAVSCRKIEDALKDTKYKTGKSTIAKIASEIPKPKK